MRENDYDVIVIGMGLSGLMAAMTLAAGGKRVLIVGKGMGSLCLFSNSVDVLKSIGGKEPGGRNFSMDFRSPRAPLCKSRRRADHGGPFVLFFSLQRALYLHGRFQR